MGTIFVVKVDANRDPGHCGNLFLLVGAARAQCALADSGLMPGWMAQVEITTRSNIITGANREIVIGILGDANGIIQEETPGTYAAR